MCESPKEDAWLWGWDATPGIVSVWAERDGRAWIWRRDPAQDTVTCEMARFRPWLLLVDLSDLAHFGDQVRDETEIDGPYFGITYHPLHGPGHLRYRVSATDGRMLEEALLHGASIRLGQTVRRIADLEDDSVLCLPPEEQYLVATGRTYFRGLTFDDLHRMQFDLETTGLDAMHDQIFLIALHSNRGLRLVLDSSEKGLQGPAAEADLIRRLAEVIRQVDPDVIENHNLQGFDMPFLVQRARKLGVPLMLGRAGVPGLRQRPATRGYGRWQSEAGEANPADTDGRERAMRAIVPGRELIDTMDAVRRYDFAARDLPGHGLKAVARHFGLTPAGRTYIEGAQVYTTWQRDPEQVRRYALDDVQEASGLAHLLGGAAFALAQMAPRRYERLADAGPATGILDPLIVRAYLHADEALPARSQHDGVQHSGAALYLFASGVAQRVVKADVASLYPSLMRQYRINSRRDHLGVLLALVERLVEQRLAAKGRAKALPAHSPARHSEEATSAAMKILVNSAYGYLGAVGLTRLADVMAANEVTSQGRALLAFLCRELAQRGATLLEADTDGVYFAVPADWTEQDERRIVAEVGDLLPEFVHLEFEGRYAAMFSHEPKNYALLGYDGTLLLRGVAFRSSKFEPFGEAFLTQAIGALLRDDMPAVRAAYLDMYDAIQQRTLPTPQVAQRVRLTKSPRQYLAARAERREAHYEAMLASGRTHWTPGERIFCYRASGNRHLLLPENEVGGRDYDCNYYLRLLTTTYVMRLIRAFTPDDFAALFASPAQMSLFAPPIAAIRPVLTTLLAPPLR